MDAEEPMDAGFCPAPVPLHRLVLIEDDGVLGRELSDFLRHRLHVPVAWYPSWQAAGATEKPGPGDVVLLDLNLPDSTGIGTLERARAAWPAVPIMVVSAVADLPVRVRSLTAWADDYLVKPFDLDELAARVIAVARRRGGPGMPDGARIRLDGRLRRVALDGQDIGLTPLEFLFLAMLIRHPGRALSRRELLEAVVGPRFYGDERVVDVHLSHVRRKLGRRQTWIETVRAFGYRWVGPPGDEAP